MAYLVAAIVALGLAGSGALAALARRKSLDRWLAAYVAQSPRRRAPRRGEEVHLLLCVADHFEPGRGGASPELADARLDRWVRDYPRLFGRFRDADGRPPQHTFFYPMEEYVPAHLDGLAGLCRAGFGEVEVHLHHDGDTPEGLRRRLLDYRDLLARRHGLLAVDRATGEPAYGFIHGNWALDNSRPDGRWCGVNCELDILRETGCYADFTLPSAPSRTQTRKINSIYHATDDPRRPRSHDRGVDLGTAPAPRDALLLIQGPLLLDWRGRKWGLLPHIESGCLQRTQPPTAERLDLWLRARVQVPGRPDWFFVKLYAHGAKEDDTPTLLGEPMVRFHEALARRAAADPSFHVHYVTARELCNLALAAADGWAGPVAGARDYRLARNAARPSRPEAAQEATGALSPAS